MLFRSAPNFSKIAQAFGINVFKLNPKSLLNKVSLEDDISDFLRQSHASLLEIFLPDHQQMMPRVKSFKKEDGTITSGSLDYMWPLIKKPSN